MEGAVGLYVLGAIVIWWLWYKGHPAIIDRPSGKRTWHDAHSKWHAIGSALTTLIIGMAGTPLVGWILSNILWTWVEVAQKYPRDKKGGVFEWWDIGWNLLGSTAMALVLHFT